jgi:endonuclease YncB( thermonuclease family)
MRQTMIVIAMWCASFAALAEPGQKSIIGHARVIDGDTIEIEGQRIRLTGIDAPESSQLCERAGKSYNCGREAAVALVEHIGENTVTCLPRGKDRYSRILALCSVNHHYVNQWMVQTGHAVAFRKYGVEYVPDEDEARIAKRGLWAGTFQMPWDYRATHNKTELDSAVKTEKAKGGGHTGVRCGNSYISANKVCHVGTSAKP